MADRDPCCQEHRLTTAITLTLKAGLALIGRRRLEAAGRASLIARLVRFGHRSFAGVRMKIDRRRN